MKNRNPHPMSGLEMQMNRIYLALVNDEKLLRLLYYSPLDAPEEERINFNPYSRTLPNLTDTDEKKWEVAEKHIFYGEKDSDLTDTKLARIYLIAGRRRPLFKNTFVSKQNFEINVIVHEDFVGDMRLEQISDRLNQILLYNHISGFSKINYDGGDPYQAPRQFQTYLHRYYFLDRSKKLC